MGMGSVLNLAGDYYEYNVSDEPDQLALWADWTMVGNDLAAAMNVVRSEVDSSHALCANG
jgi:hypothetical protein